MPPDNKSLVALAYPLSSCPPLLTMHTLNMTKSKGFQNPFFRLLALVESRYTSFIENSLYL